MNFNVLFLKNKKIKRLVNINLLISFLTCIFSIILMWIYNIFFISIYLFDISFLIFRIGILIGVFSYMCGIVFENYLDT